MKSSRKKIFIKKWIVKKEKKKAYWKKKVEDCEINIRIDFTATCLILNYLKIQIFEEFDI